MIFAFAKSRKNSNVLLCPDSNKYSSVENQTVRLNRLNSGSMLNHIDVLGVCFPNKMIYQLFSSIYKAPFVIFWEIN